LRRTWAEICRRKRSAWAKNRETKEPYAWSEQRGYRVCDHARTEGVWLRPLGNVVVIMPPLAITLNELDRICTAAERGIAHATAE